MEAGEDLGATRTPGVSESSAAAPEFVCPNCGAGMTWDPGPDAMVCAYCEHRIAVPRGEGTIVERELAAAGDAARGLGLELRVSRCGNCGASVAHAGASTARACVYCGSANVLAQEANRNAIRPDSLVPLDVSRKEVEQNFRRWLGGLWFRPDDLKKAKEFDALGIYVPYWTFDCRVHSDWSADSGTYYYVTVPRTVIVNGRPRIRMVQERRVRWRPAWGERDDAYDEHLILASRGLSSKLVERLGQFDTRALVPYKPEYLSGWLAEEYQVDLEQGWLAAQQAIVASQRARCAGDIPGDTHRNLQVRNRISDVRWKHVLLPIWSLQYRFSGKVYTVLVNGQTGAVAGDAPFSWAKIALLVLVILIAIPIVIGILSVL